MSVFKVVKIMSILNILYTSGYRYSLQPTGAFRIACTKYIIISII